MRRNTKRTLIIGLSAGLLAGAILDTNWAPSSNASPEFTISASLAPFVTIDSNILKELPKLFAYTDDVSIAKTDGVTQVAPGAIVSYTITVRNLSDKTVLVGVKDSLPAQFAAAVWGCLPSAGSDCQSGTNGTGSIKALVVLLKDGSTVFQMNAQLRTDATGPLVNTALMDNFTTVVGNTSSEFKDNNVSNNLATDTDQIVAPTTSTGATTTTTTTTTVAATTSATIVVATAAAATTLAPVTVTPTTASATTLPTAVTQPAPVATAAALTTAPPPTSAGPPQTIIIIVRQGGTTRRIIRKIVPKKRKVLVVKKKAKKKVVG